MKNPIFLLLLLSLFCLPGWSQSPFFTDEFLHDSTILKWQNISRTEGWGAGQLEIIRTEPTDGGQLLLSPYPGVWHDDKRGPFLYRNVKGNFIFTAELSVSHRDGALVHLPQGALAGCLARVPSGPNPYGSRPVNENYAYLALGNGNAQHPSCIGCRAPHLEVKTTAKSLSHYFIAPAQDYRATLRIARVDSVLFLLVKYQGGAFALHQKIMRPDFPEELQVGMMLNLAFPQGSAYASPEMMARFRYAKLEAVAVPPALRGRNLYHVPEKDLLAFLGDAAGEKPATQEEAEPEKWLSMWETASSSSSYLAPRGGNRFSYTWDETPEDFHVRSWSRFQSEMRIQDAMGKQLSAFETSPWGAGYSACWDEDAGKKVVVRTRNWVKLERELEFRFFKNYRMVDLDIGRQGGGICYYGIWERGGAEQRLFRSDDPRAFAQQNTTFAQMGFHLADIEAVSAGDKTLYIGLWQEGATPVKLVFHDSRDHFEAVKVNMAKAGMELVEVVRVK